MCCRARRSASAFPATRGAGTSPSDKNDPDKLRDNLMPYALAGHVHEREVERSTWAMPVDSCRMSPRISAD